MEDLNDIENNFNGRQKIVFPDYVANPLGTKEAFNNRQIANIDVMEKSTGSSLSTELTNCEPSTLESPNFDNLHTSMSNLSRKSSESLDNCQSDITSDSAGNANNNNVAFSFTRIPQVFKEETRKRQCYHLLIRQQPKHSRMCGFGEKVDRRPIDPPPIIEFSVDESDVSSVGSSFSAWKSSAIPRKKTRKMYLHNPFFFMCVKIIDPEHDRPVQLSDNYSMMNLQAGSDNQGLFSCPSTFDAHDFSMQKVSLLTGSFAASPFRLRDTQQKEGAFFVFPDLSVRMEGLYRLKFVLYEITGDTVHYCSHVISDVFRVYSAKKFPGMQGSTPLSRLFAEQGIKLRVRKDGKRMRANSSIIVGPYDPGNEDGNSSTEDSQALTFSGDKDEYLNNRKSQSYPRFEKANNTLTFPGSLGNRGFNSHAVINIPNLNNHMHIPISNMSNAIAPSISYNSIGRNVMNETAFRQIASIPPFDISANRAAAISGPNRNPTYFPYGGIYKHSAAPSAPLAVFHRPNHPSNRYPIATNGNYNNHHRMLNIPNNQSSQIHNIPNSQAHSIANSHIHNISNNQIHTISNSHIHSIPNNRISSVPYNPTLITSSRNNRIPDTEQSFTSPFQNINISANDFTNINHSSIGSSRQTIAVGEMLLDLSRSSKRELEETEDNVGDEKKDQEGGNFQDSGDSLNGAETKFRNSKGARLLSISNLLNG